MAKTQTNVHEGSYELTVTIDCAIFGYSGGILKILLVKRGIDPYKGFWMLPGGAMQENETLEDTLKRVLKKIVGVSDVYVHQVGTYSDVNRHPVKRVMTTGYYALVKPENHDIVAKEHIVEADWFSVNEVGELGFDHNQLFEDARKKMKDELFGMKIAAELLEEKFTLSELQDLFEIIMEEKLDKRNFRRKLEAQNVLKPTKEVKTGVKGGPLLYEFDKKIIHNKG